MDKKLYHTYLDEGGIFGSATLSINSKKLKVSKKDNHITQFYIGKINKKSIIRHLQLFNKCFPKCRINFHELSEIKLTNEVFKN